MLPLHHHHLLFQQGSEEWLQMPLGVAGTSARSQQWWCPWHFCHEPLGLPAEPSLGRREKKREKKNLLPVEPNLRPMLRICLQNSGRTFQEGHRAPRLWGRRMGQGAGVPVTEPVQALPWLWTSAGKSSINSSPRRASLLPAASCSIRATISLPRKRGTREKQKKRNHNKINTSQEQHNIQLHSRCTRGRTGLGRGEGRGHTSNVWLPKPPKGTQALTSRFKELHP